MIVAEHSIDALIKFDHISTGGALSSIWLHKIFQ